MQTNLPAKLLACGFLLFNFTERALAETQSLPKECEMLFSATEKVIEEAEKQPGTHLQFVSIKNKLNQSKQQILAMELKTQIQSCDKGLVALNNRQELTLNK